MAIPDGDAGYCYQRNAMITRFPINEVNCVDISLKGRDPSTFPAEAPLFHLDRIWTNPIDGIKKVGVPKDDLTQQASDHLPIWARVEL